MPSSYMRGALIEFTTTMLIPLPNVIIFQYNPETISHAWTVPSPSPVAGNPLAVPGVPGETFSFTLLLDANDDVGSGNPIAIASGIYSRLAALEMLIFPTSVSPTAGLLGTVTASVSAGGASIGGSATSGAAAQPQVPVSVAPTVLFIWGPGRIVPVRVTALTVSEKIFDALLNPTHAEVQITLKVLTPDELQNLQGPLASVAQAAYAYTQGERQVLALANLAIAVGSIIGMIPT
jgi:hypothetical protein